MKKILVCQRSELFSGQADLYRNYNILYKTHAYNLSVPLTQLLCQPISSLNCNFEEIPDVTL